MYFGSAPRLTEALIDQLASVEGITRVVVDLGSLGRVDYTGAIALKTFVDESGDAGLEAHATDVLDEPVVSDHRPVLLVIDFLPARSP